MESIWTEAIGGGWTVFNDVFGQLLPVIAIAIGLAIVGVVVGMFMGNR